MTPEEFKARGIPIPSTWHLWEELFKRTGHKVRPFVPLFRLVITGSTVVTPAMRACITRAVTRAKSNGYEIVTRYRGGVDQAVVEECTRQHVRYTRVTEEADLFACDRLFLVTEANDTETPALHRRAVAAGKTSDLWA